MHYIGYQLHRHLWVELGGILANFGGKERSLKPDASLKSVSRWRHMQFVRIFPENCQN